MIYRFGPYELDVERFELRNGDAQVAVEPQVFGVLAHLLLHRDRVVSRDDLIDAVWDGRIVSDATLSSRISAARHAVGDSGDAQAVIRTIPRRGFRFVADVAADPAPSDAAPRSPGAAPGFPPPSFDQKVRFCTSADGTRIAYATVGSGPPLVRAGHWLTHLESDLHSPVWRPFIDRLAQDFALTRYDQRGNGLSDWTITSPDLDDFVADLAAVVDAAGLDRFALYGTSQGAPIGVAYAVRHPERISHLILHGGYARGRLKRDDPAEREQGEAIIALMRHGWGRAGSPFIKAFTSMYIPGGTAEQTNHLADLQRRTTSPENAVALRRAVDSFDVSGLLAQVRVPTLVLHARDDGVHPLDEGRGLAAAIPGAEFVLLDSANHVILPQEPAWEALFTTIGRFVRG